MRRKRFAFRPGSFFLGAILFLLFAETAARISGLRSWQVRHAEIVVEPGGRFYKPHPTLGYTHLAGQLKATLGGSYTFNVTNLSNTLRVTGPLNCYQSKSGRGGFGSGAIPYSMAGQIINEETYPWLLQERVPNYKVVNLVVGDYGTLLSSIQLREALRNDEKP